jgi:hypothetical protein
MPQYRVGEQTFRRKHTWLPCAINDRLDGMSEEDVVAAYRAAYWADLITDAEWRALLREDGCNPSARSRLKRKAAGWFVALGRIAALDPELYSAIFDQAERLYGEQIGERHPVLVREKDLAA